ncbi:response regulator [Paenibacillus chondroitinus]|uniref:Response regulator n=1 Tax=Paenibacillus chondroitinus TaxID=59842 RepID=A0ABU6DCL7_9BACL|nr:MULTISPECIES: response regulator [Paenibacillus]MCY9659876.1 response regulator [Paenibacillus anseongense]MEB4795506.1 response regulator [Paenibacillus chondroitinus]
MKKVMLVDDEILIRETVRECIQWEQEGFIYCGDAPDGEMALTLIEQLRPDIIITDIMMPFMNGLELSAIVRERYPEVKIIILTGHEDFGYARTALRMGVHDYCLKPIHALDLIQLLRNASEMIDKEREIKASIDKLRQSELEKIEVSREKLLNDLCSGFVTTIEAIQLGATLSLDLQARYYVVVISDVRSLEDKPIADTGVASQVEHNLIGQFQKALESKELLQFKRSRTEICWLIKGETLEQIQYELGVFKEILNMINEQTPAASVSIAVGIGSVQERLMNIHISFLEAVEDMHWRRLSSQNRITLWESISGSMEQYVFLDRAWFVNFLKMGSPSQLSSFLEEYASALAGVDWISSPIGYYILNDLTLEVFRSAKDMYRHWDAPEDTLQQLQQILKTVRSMEDAIQYLTSLTNQFWSWRSQTNDRYGDMLRSVKEYIHANYNNDTFSLQDAAEHVKVSSSHLSKVFSQETGRTFIEYLTHYRIYKAMELFKTTSYKSFEIAFLVGYNDSHYFSTLFKRITGMTTKEFKKSGNLDSTLLVMERSEASEQLIKR